MAIRAKRLKVLGRVVLVISVDMIDIKLAGMLRGESAAVAAVRKVDSVAAAGPLRSSLIAVPNLRRLHSDRIPTPPLDSPTMDAIRLDPHRATNRTRANARRWINV